MSQQTAAVSRPAARAPVMWGIVVGLLQTQARILRARQLVQRAAEDHASRQVATRLVPGEESEVERADAFDEHVAQQARTSQAIR